MEACAKLQGFYRGALCVIWDAELRLGHIGEAERCDTLLPLRGQAVLLGYGRQLIAAHSFQPKEGTKEGKQREYAQKESGTTRRAGHQLTQTALA